jgi:FtsZ-binding cell division protein ZapB
VDEEVRHVNTTFTNLRLKQTFYKMASEENLKRKLESLTSELSAYKQHNFPANSDHTLKEEVEDFQAQMTSLVNKAI